MAVQALYRRWRPQSFDEVIGQAHITRTLRNALASGRLVHAYLFTGPRGTGKTSVARILAKAVNCTGEGEKPCNECAMCRAITDGRALDLIEIDAASNTGVDDVRDLREKIGFSPNEAAYKVYVIDEVHMLSRAAFNALLKTLEEPPPHVLFILATTESHKIPDTILSRCQRHDFRRVPLDDLVGKLERICEAEGVTAERAALALVARSATGSIRDAESLLDQLVAATDTVRVADVRAALGTPTDDAVAELVDAILDRDAAAGLRLISAVLDRGTDARQLRSRLLDHLRGLLLIQTGVDADLLQLEEEALERMRQQADRLSTATLASAIHRFDDARPSPDRTQPALALELALVEAVLEAEGEDSEGPAHQAPSATTPSAAPDRARQSDVRAQAPPTKPAGDTSAATVKAAPAEAAPTEAGPVPRTSAPGPTEAAEEVIADARPDAEKAHAPGRTPSRAEALAQVTDRWGAIMDAVAHHDRNTAALLKDCRPVAADEQTVTVGFFYEFHCQRVSEPERRALVSEAFEEVLGRPCALRCKVVAPNESEIAVRPRSKSDQAKTDPVVRHAVEELGARVVSVQTPPDDQPPPSS